MPNRFNTLLENQPYVSTYVPLPLDTMMKIGAMKQDEFDKNLDKIGQVKDALAINADPNRAGYRDALLSKYNNKISNIADQYVKTGDAGLINQVNDLKRQFVNDPLRQTLESSYANWKQFQKDAETYKKESKYSDIYNSYMRDKPLDESGNLTGFNYEGMLTKQNYYDAADKIMKGIASDKQSWKGYKSDASGMPNVGEHGQYWKTGHSESGVSEPKVIKVARDNADAFLRTDEGRFFIDEMIGSPINYNDLNENQKDILKKSAVDYLLKVGSKQIGLDVSNENDVNFLSGDQLDRLRPKTIDHFVTFTPQQPGDSSDKDARLTSGLPKEIQATMEYKNGKLVSKSKTTDDFLSNLKTALQFVVDPGMAVYQKTTQAVRDVKNAVNAYKDIKPLLTNYALSSGLIKDEKELNDSKKFLSVKDKYAEHVADAIIANREVLFDQTTAGHISEAILPTSNSKGDVVNPNLMGSTTVYDLNGNIKDNNEILIGGKILGPDSKHSGRLLIGARDGKQYSIDPNIPDLKLTMNNIANFDQGVIDRVVTGVTANTPEILKEFYTGLNNEIDKLDADPKIKEAIKLDYINNANKLVQQGYKMTTVRYGEGEDGYEYPVGIKYNSDGSVDKKVITDAPGLGTVTVDIGEFKNMKTQESFINAGLLPQFYNESNKQYQANVLRK